MLFIEISPHKGKLILSVCEKKFYTIECLERFECESKDLNRELEAILLLTNNLTTREKL